MAQAAIIALAHHTALRHGAFRPTLSRLLDFVRPGPLDMPYQGASFRLHHRGSATERGALLNPDYNLDELKFLRAHLRDDAVFVDVGANVGTYALALARDVGTRGKVIAIEPHPVAHARLAFNHAASGYGGVKLVQAAAGADDGELLMETDGDNLAASRIVADNASGKATRVPSLRLQRIVQEAGAARIDALKIDVEGYEDRVLTGFFREAPPTLWPKAVVIEHLSRRQWQGDCIADMASRGYRVSGKTHSNTLLVRS